MTSSADAAAALLRRPETIRERCGALLALAEADQLPHFVLRAERLDVAAEYVVDTVRVRRTGDGWLTGTTVVLAPRPEATSSAIVGRLLVARAPASSQCAVI